MCCSMTCYHWDGKGGDPNRDVALCAECEKGYAEFWDDMWQEYYSSVM